jgi:hypothetical protein
LIFVSSVFRTNDCFTVWTSYISSLVTFLALDNVKFYFFCFTNAFLVFVWVVLWNGALVNEYVFICIISCNETITIFDIEPLDCTSYSACLKYINSFIFFNAPFTTLFDIFLRLNIHFYQLMFVLICSILFIFVSIDIKA